MTRTLLAEALRDAALLCLCCAAITGCSKDVKGPAPEVEPPSTTASPPPVEPPIVCRDQLSTDVVIHGEGFSPIPIDIPDDPRVALPSVLLTWQGALQSADATATDPIRYSGNPDDPTNAFAADGETPLLTWQSAQQMTFTVNQSIEQPNGPAGPLPEGVYDVTVENPNGERVDSAGSLAVIGKPTLDALEPTVVCLEQGDRELALTGTRFLRNGSASMIVQVEGVSQNFGVELADCEAIDHAGLDAEVCGAATLPLSRGIVPVGYPGLTLHNPETAACTSEEDVKLRVVPAPTIDRVEEPLACVAEGARSFVIHGTGFLRIDDEPPAIQVGDTAFEVSGMDGCEDVEAQGTTVESCTSVSFSIGEGELSPDQYTVTLENPQPAGCNATATGALRIAAPPSIDTVVPPLVCLDDGAREITVEGGDFLVVDGTLPTVTVDGMDLDTADVAAEGCADLPTEGLAVMTCDRLVVTLAQAGVGTGQPDVSVENPQPAGCSDTRTGLLTVVDGPTITGTEPVLVCTDDGARPLAILGTGFLEIDGYAPSVTIDGESVDVDSVDGCEDVDVAGLTVRRCDTLNVTLAQGLLAGDMTASRQPLIAVENPQPAGCAASSEDVLTIPPVLSITSVVESNLCSTTAGDVTVTVTGTGLLRVSGGDAFSVEVNGTAATPANVTGCTELGTTGVETCTGFELTVTPSTLLAGGAGDVPIAITNPDPSGCAGAFTDVFRIVAPPMVTDVVEDRICSDVEETITITGTDLAAGATVLAGQNCEADPGACVAADTVTLIDTSTLEVTFGDGIPEGTVDITVQNAADCASTLPAALTVDPTPLVFFVDPPVTYNGVRINATIFTSGLAADATTVQLAASDGTLVTPALDFSSPTRPNRIQATIPDGLDADDYEVRVTSDLGCVGINPGALTVTDSLTIDLDAITPSFVSPSQPTAVTITANDPAASGMVQFEATPRVYLNPRNPPSADAVATALPATTFVDATSLTAVIPVLAQDDYDLIVVNPSGAVGLLTVTVPATEPPVITNALPASLVSNSTTTVSLEGDNFDASAILSLRCREPDGSITMVAAEGGTTAVPDANDASADFDVGGVAARSICIAQLENPDGALAEYSAISITNSSLNLSPWTDAPDMNEGRRAPSLAAGRPTFSSRFLYAIGGDVGVTNMPRQIGTTVHDSVESANVNIFGEMGEFRVQRNLLPEPRTWGGAARIGSFVYSFGGNDGSAVSDKTFRAQVLDPLQTPEVVDLDAVLGDGTTGLSGGQWFYRVAAILDGADANNPGGESLPGELLTVQLPDRDEGIVLTLIWSQQAGAVGYRVYRSPAADGPVDELELLAEVSGGTTTSYTDQGDATMANMPPLGPGALGVWHEVAAMQLNTAREAHAAAVVQDPGDASRYFVYAIGGRDGGGNYLDSYEVASVTVNGDGTQTETAWNEQAGALSVARGELGAWVITEDNAKLVSSGEVFVYAGHGRIDSGFSTTVEAALLDTTAPAFPGALEPLSVVNRLPMNMAGYGYGQANNQLFTFGGNGGNPSGGGNSAGICDDTAPDMNCFPPDLKTGSWNNLGNGAPNGTRIYAGSTQESAFFFLAGGHDGNDALSSAEQTAQ